MRPELIDSQSFTIGKLPKTELHVHLRGSIPHQTIQQLINKYSVERIWKKIPLQYKILFKSSPKIREFVKAKDPRKDVSKLYEFDSFDQFLIQYFFLGFFIRESQDFCLLVRDVVSSLKEQNIIYAEITFTLREYSRLGLTFDDFSYSFDEADKISGIKVRWLVDLVRDRGPRAALLLLKKVISWGDSRVIGITLGGSEHRFPARLFPKVYKVAKDAGLHLTIHAGEAAGPRSVWDAVKLLNVERIGHGVRSIEDPKLVEYLAENKIPLEVCVTSNLKTKIYPSYEAHPVRKLYKAGIPLTINSDDPTFFGSNLNNEYKILKQIGFTNAELRDLIKNGFRYAFLPEADKALYLKAPKS